MKLVKILAIALLALPLSAFARGFLVPVIPTSSITIGGQQSFTVTTGEKIPLIRWKSVNGTDFKTTWSVNNPALCGGIKDNQPWGQGRTAAGNFDLGIAPKAREGCVLTFNYEVTSRTGHKAVDRAVLRYVAPKLVVSTNPQVPTKPISTTPSVQNLSVEVTSPAGGEFEIGQKLPIKWTAKNIKSDNEFFVYIERTDGRAQNIVPVRLDSESISYNWYLDPTIEKGDYVAKVAVTSGGADTLKNAKHFISKKFSVVGLDQKDVLKILSPSKSVFRPGEIMNIHWTGYEPGLEIYSLHLMHKYSSYEREIASNIDISKETPEDTKVFYWTIPDDIEESEYYIELRSKAFGVESSEFKIEKDDTTLEINTTFTDIESVANNDSNSSRDYKFHTYITPSEDIYIGMTGMRGIEYIVEGPAGSKYTSFGSNQIFGKDGIEPITVNGVELWKIPKGSTAGIESVVTISNVSPAGQYRVKVVGLSYAKNLSKNEYGGLTFTAKTFDVPYKTAYRTINSSGFFGSLFNKFGFIGDGLGSIGVGVLKLFQVF